MSESEKEYRLQRFVKYVSWERIYYNLNRADREWLFDKLKNRIEEFEKEEMTGEPLICSSCGIKQTPFDIFARDDVSGKWYCFECFSKVVKERWAKGK